MDKRVTARRVLLWLQRDDDAARASRAVRAAGSYVSVINDPDTLEPPDWVVVSDLVFDTGDDDHASRGVSLARATGTTLVRLSMFCKWAELSSLEWEALPRRPGSATLRRLEL